jgi:hypothetical protein
MDTCAKCSEKSPSTILQHSRKFNHGNINEPIPDNSHIYGGKWYYNALKKWGPPPSEIIEFAIQYQKEARNGFVVEETKNDELIIDEKQSIAQEMPRAKKTEVQTSDETPPPVKRGRKPKVAPVEPSDNITPTETKTPVKRTRKPKVAPETTSEPAITPPVEPKKRTPAKKKSVETPYSTLVNSTNQMIHKEVSLPTHIENKLEEIDSEGFQIEYIKLSLFEANGSTYFRDTSKNKLYKKIKEKGIGAYVGRWNPDTESIVSDIPDSDDEE